MGMRKGGFNIRYDGKKLIAKNYTIESATTTFTASDFSSVSAVMIDGVSTTDYTIDNKVITFTNELAANTVLTIVGQEA